MLDCFTLTILWHGKMKGKLIRISLALTIFILIGLTIISNCTAEKIISTHNIHYDIIVDKNGQGDYFTIQEAINNAQEGSTIYVKKGSYSEIIEIEKQISLIGEDKEKTIINPISKQNKYAVRLGAPKAMLSNLGITNGAPGLYTSGIRITAENTEINNCNIYNTPVGVAIWTSNNKINNCNFWDCEDEGIALLGSQYSKCENNEIKNCIFHDNCDGIELQYSSGNIITDCEFYKNTHTGIDAIASSNDKNIISKCKIYKNKVNGIYLRSSSDNQIIDCTISENKNGNIVMNENSKNNQLKNINDKIELENDKEEKSTINTISLENKIKEENEKNNMISRFFNTISNLRLFISGLIIHL